MIKESALQENIIILLVYEPNNRASNRVRQNLIELQRETDEFTIVLEISRPLYQRWTDLADRKS